MSPKEFEEALQSLLHREPFRPFIVEYTHGERFEVDGPFVAHSGGYAGFIGPEPQVFFFDHTNVQQFLPVAVESQS